MKPMLKADVIRNEGRTIHSLGRIVDGLPVPTIPSPPASRVEISAEADGGYSLIRFDPADGFCGDTWHQSLEEAQRQAEFEFGIALEDWE